MAKKSILSKEANSANDLPCFSCDSNSVKLIQKETDSNNIKINTLFDSIKSRLSRKIITYENNAIPI